MLDGCLWSIILLFSCITTLSVCEAFILCNKFCLDLLFCTESPPSSHNQIAFVQTKCFNHRCWNARLQCLTGWLTVSELINSSNFTVSFEKIQTWNILQKKCFFIIFSLSERQREIFTTKPGSKLNFQSLLGVVLVLLLKVWKTGIAKYDEILVFYTL